MKKGLLHMLLVALVSVLMMGTVGSNEEPKAPLQENIATDAPTVLDARTQETQKAIDQQLEDTQSLVWLLLKMIFFLFVVCGFAVWILRILMPRNRWSALGGGFFEVVMRMPIEARKSLILVRLSERYHLLGVSDHNINFLTTLSDEEALDLEKGLQSNPNSAKRSFWDYIQKRSLHMGSQSGGTNNSESV